MSDLEKAIREGKEKYIEPCKFCGHKKCICSDREKAKFLPREVRK